MLSADAIVAQSGMDNGSVSSIERIKHGLTNESWLVSSAGARRVVRISNSEEESLQINRASEATILDVVSRAGIGPDVIACDPAQRLLVTRYMGETWSDADAQQPGNIERIAVLLRRLHGLAAPPDVQRVDLLTVIEGYLETLDANSIVGGLTTPTLRTCAHDIATALYQRAAECLCHNDVHALNIVESAADGTLRLIDWEYAGLGEPMFDLASISVYHRYSEEQRERLLRAYSQRTAAADWQRLQLACWLFDYIRDLWTAVRELGAKIESPLARG